jgi:geranylgeranyl reductase family protein
MSNEPEHDVIVVGASLAGCSTASTLAKRGRSVLLLDKSAFPRWKPCAGGVTLKARPYVPEDLTELFECTMRGAYLTFGDEYVTHIRAEGVLGWMVHREAFDEAHLQLVRSHPNVDFAPRVAVRSVVERPDRVVVSTAAGDLTARAVVGADGANSVVSRALPGHDEREIGFAYEGEVRLPELRLTEDVVFDFRRFPRGYGWIFPKHDHYSVGGFVYRRNLSGIKRIYDEFRAETGLLAHGEIGRTRGHRIPHGGSARRVNARRILLAGDAADLVDPLTGEGIYYALRSGHLAGHALADFLGDGRPLDVYGDRVRDEIQEEFRYARMVARLLFGRPRTCYRLLLRNSLVCRWFVEILVGARSYRSLIREVLRKGFLLPFHAGLSRRRAVRVAIGDRSGAGARPTTAIRCDPPAGPRRRGGPAPRAGASTERLG